MAYTPDNPPKKVDDALAASTRDVAPPPSSLMELRIRSVNPPSVTFASPTGMYSPTALIVTSSDVEFPDTASCHPDTATACTHGRSYRMSYADTDEILNGIRSDPPMARARYSPIAASRASSSSSAIIIVVVVGPGSSSGDGSDSPPPPPGAASLPSAVAVAGDAVAA